MPLAHLSKLTIFHSSHVLLFSLCFLVVLFTVFSFRCISCEWMLALETWLGSVFSKNTSRRCCVQFSFLAAILLLSSLWHSSSGYPPITNNHFIFLQPWECLIWNYKQTKQIHSGQFAFDVSFLLHCDLQSSSAFFSFLLGLILILPSKGFWELSFAFPK